MSTAFARRQPAALAREDVELRMPRSTDGARIHDLVARCKPLDENSMYCNLLQATHFRATSIAAEGPDGDLLGFISGYLLPERDDTLFIWQVAVSADARGLGLGKAMLGGILQRSRLADVSYLHTTVGPDNGPSWGMFRSLARDLEAPVHTTLMFSSERHFGGAHEDEVLLQIGPFDASDPA